MRYAFILEIGLLNLLMYEYAQYFNSHSKTAVKLFEVQIEQQ